MFCQVYLKRRRLKRKFVEFPQTKPHVFPITSSLLVYGSEDENYSVYDHSTSLVLPTIFDYKPKSMESFKSCSVVCAESKPIRIYSKLTRRFYNTDFLGSKQYLISEFNSMLFIQTETLYGIVRLLEDAPPEYIFKAQRTLKEDRFYLTTSYLLEFNKLGILSCIPFDFKLLEDPKAKSAEYSYDQDIRNLKVIGNVSKRDLAVSPSNIYYLLSPDEPPLRFDYCF